MTDETLILCVPGHGSRMQLRASGGTAWLTPAERGQLYDISVPKIVQTISRVLAAGEVAEAIVNSALMVRQEGGRSVRRGIKIQDLDKIVAASEQHLLTRADKVRVEVAKALEQKQHDDFDALCKQQAALDADPTVVAASRELEQRGEQR